MRREKRHVCTVEMENSVEVFLKAASTKVQFVWRNRPGEFVPHHRGKTRCFWSKMQRDIRVGD